MKKISENSEGQTRHAERLAGFESHEEVVEALVALRYDALRDILEGVSKALYRDAMADAERGRHRLALALFKAANGVQAAHEGVVQAWRICEPHMDTNHGEAQRPTSNKNQGLEAKST